MSKVGRMGQTLAGQKWMFLSNWDRACHQVVSMSASYCKGPVGFPLFSKVKRCRRDGDGGGGGVQPVGVAPRCSRLGLETVTVTTARAYDM